MYCVFLFSAIKFTLSTKWINQSGCNDVSGSSINKIELSAVKKIRVKYNSNKFFSPEDSFSIGNNSLVLVNLISISPVFRFICILLFHKHN